MGEHCRTAFYDWISYYEVRCYQARGLRRGDLCAITNAATGDIPRSGEIDRGKMRPNANSIGEIRLIPGRYEASMALESSVTATQVAQ